jgi:Na+/H+ antiporter NhaD/arsenite permease-like protein
MILLLALSSLVDPDFSFLGGIICLALGILCIPWLCRTRGIGVWRLIRRLDFETALFLASIFVLVGSLAEAGLMDDIALMVQKFLGSDRFLIYTFFVWFSVLMSAFIDNVPYITTMLPVTRIISQNLGASPYLLSFGLLIGSCLGGNITPVGAAANVVSVSMLKREGHHVSFTEFARIGLPFALSATFGSYLFVWFLWR